MEARENCGMNSNNRENGMQANRVQHRIRTMLLTIVILSLSLIQARTASGQSALEELTDAQVLDVVRDMRYPAQHQVTPGSNPAMDGKKCGFGISAEVARRWSSSSVVMRDEFRELMAPQARHISILSPSGRFRIHYDTSDYHEAFILDAQNNQIPNSAHAYADSVARVFDDVYQKQVADIGYDPPPYEPGQDAYNIYVLEFRGSLYGQTVFNSPTGISGTLKPTYASYMEIDNDFLRYATKGMAGLKVTAAHEYHHMVQLGTYGLWLTDRWMHEMTSTYYEEVCYPAANDYFQYLADFMQNADRPWYNWGSGGYEMVLLPLFFEHKYDPTLIREIWEGMRQVEPVTAMRNAIRDHAPLSGDLSSDVCSFARANFFTGFRADRKDPNPYADAAAMPRVQLATSTELVGESATLMGMLQPLGASYLRVFRGIDTLTFVAANTDIAAAIARSGVSVSFEIEVRSSGYDDSYTELDNGWAYKMTAASPNVLCVSHLEGGSGSQIERSAPFPNPFHPLEYSRVVFPVPRNVSTNRADLFLFTVSMDAVVRRESVPIELDDVAGAFVAWDGRGDDGEFLASGVYFYILKYGDEIDKGKIAVVNR